MTGQARISLEAYVQTAYFDRIIRHANLRLLHMSHGQYELKRRQVKEGGTQGEVGLDLDVMDHYNGSVRDVGTLSGGEGFLAALSLALGMSDTIQASAASAVRLDTMFVDEGFGSLSGSFLELAMGELMDTAENGQIVACLVDGEDATLKRFRRQRDMVLLQPENPAYEPKLIPLSDFETGAARIVGVAVRLVREL